MTNASSSKFSCSIKWRQLKRISEAPGGLDPDTIARRPHAFCEGTGVLGEQALIRRIGGCRACGGSGLALNAFLHHNDRVGIRDGQLERNYTRACYGLNKIREGVVWPDEPDHTAAHTYEVLRHAAAPALDTVRLLDGWDAGWRFNMLEWAKRMFTLITLQDLEHCAHIHGWSEGCED